MSRAGLTAARRRTKHGSGATPSRRSWRCVGVGVAAPGKAGDGRVDARERRAVGGRIGDIAGDDLHFRIVDVRARGIAHDGDDVVAAPRCFIEDAVADMAAGSVSFSE